MTGPLALQLTDRLTIEALELEALKHGVTPEGLATTILNRTLAGLSPLHSGVVDPLDAKVASLVADRYADTDIAALLGISPSTVARKRSAQHLAKNYRNDPNTRVITSTLGRDTP